MVVRPPAHPPWTGGRIHKQSYEKERRECEAGDQGSCLWGATRPQSESERLRILAEACQLLMVRVRGPGLRAGRRTPAGPRGCAARAGPGRAAVQRRQLSEGRRRRVRDPRPASRPTRNAFASCSCARASTVGTAFDTRSTATGGCPDSRRSTRTAAIASTSASRTGGGDDCAWACGRGCADAFGRRGVREQRRRSHPAAAGHTARTCSFQRPNIPRRFAFHLPSTTSAETRSPARSSGRSTATAARRNGSNVSHTRSGMSARGVHFALTDIDVQVLEAQDDDELAQHRGGNFAAPLGQRPRTMQVLRSLENSQQRRAGPGREGLALRARNQGFRMTDINSKKCRMGAPY